MDVSIAQPTDISPKKVIGLSVSVLVIIIFYLIPVPAGLNEAGKNVIGLLLAGLILWVSEALPLSITAIALIVMQPILNISSPLTAFKTFMSPVIFFVIATFGISVAVMKTPLAARIASWMLSKAKDDSAKVVLAFMTGSALLSAIISNVPVSALFMGLSLSILKASGSEPGTSRLGRCLMIAIPFGAMIGGIMTIAGSSINILTLYLLEEYAGVTITFVEWMAFGIPVALVLLPVTWILLIKFYKPEPIKKGLTAEISKNVPAKITIMEKKLLIIVGLMMFIWIISSWIKGIDITIVALVGLIAFFIPGINILNWDEFADGVGWDTIIMIGGVISLGAAVVQTGVGKWVVEQSLVGLSGWNVFLLAMAVGMLVNILHLVLPIAPAIVAVVIPPLVVLSQVSGIPPQIFALTTAFLSGCSMLLPLDAVPLITFSKRYYTMWDMFKVGVFTSTIWVILAGIWIPFMAGFIY